MSGFIFCDVLFLFKVVKMTYTMSGIILQLKTHRTAPKTGATSCEGPGAKFEFDE